MKNTCETCRHSSAVKKEILNILICLNPETYRTTMRVLDNACSKYEETYNADNLESFKTKDGKVITNELY